jgi:hydroxypyruvate isomerase
MELVWEHERFSAADWTEFLSRKTALKMTVDTVAAHHASPLDPAQHDKVLADIRASATAAHRLECPCLILLSGPERPGVPRVEQHRAMVEVYKRAAEIAGKENLTLVLEPLNTLVDHKGNYLWSAREGFEMVREVGSPRMKLLFDVYHTQVMEGFLIQQIRDNIANIGLFHVADVPGRHDPGTGEINYANVFKTLSEVNYTGRVAMEYRPVKGRDHVESLKVARALAVG